jgi:hypothetical protein
MGAKPGSLFWYDPAARGDGAQGDVLAVATDADDAAAGGGDDVVEGREMRGSLKPVTLSSRFI